jgi:hypothetical protein
MQELIDGVLEELREMSSTTPTKTMAALLTLRKRLDEKNLGGRRQKQIEQELETFLHSTPALRIASERHLRKTALPLIKAALATLEEARRFLAQHKRPRGLPN